MIIEPHIGMLQTILYWFNSSYPEINITACRTEKEAFRILQQEPIDLILLSIENHTPQCVQNIEKTRSLKPQVKMVLLITLEDEIYQDAYLKAGADDCIAKVNLFNHLPPYLNELMNQKALEA